MRRQSGSKASHHPTRRRFLETSAVAAGATLAATAAGGNYHLADSDVLKVGLIGCGGRGTGAAGQALKADPRVKLTAMGDVFADQLKSSLARLQQDPEITGKVQVAEDKCFVGFDAYKGVLASGVDVVLLTTPPHFRPMHLKAAVEAGKHVFAEKPCCVDVPGAKSVLTTCEEAGKKGLSVVTGLCYRYDPPKQETMKRVHDGMVGDIVAMHTTYDTGYLRMFKRESAWSDMEWQLRNWLYFTWLSGDHIVEQHVHSLDKMAWAMKNQYPVKAIGLGGRQVRTSQDYGNIFDHHAVVFEYPNGIKVFSYCRQQQHCHNETSDFIMGTKGTCDVMKHAITGQNKWRYTGEKPSMYQKEHDALFASIRQGKPINDGEFMTKSSLMGIMGRMATYTGQLVTWEKLMKSKDDLSPAQYEFGSLPMPPVPMPGITKLV